MSTPYFSFYCLRKQKLWQAALNVFFFLFCNVLNNFHPKLEFEAFLRTKGQTAGGAKELWTKLLVAQKNSGQSCCLQKEVWAFFADISFVQSSFVPPAVLPTPAFAQTAVTVLRSLAQLASAVPLVLMKASNSNFGCKLLKTLLYKSQNIWCC